jgi:hypothetical protein
MSTECGVWSLDSSEDFDYVYKTTSEIAKGDGAREKREVKQDHHRGQTYSAFFHYES